MAQNPNTGVVGGGRSSTAQANGQVVAQRMGNLADSIVSQLHPRYYEQTYSGNRFVVANQAAVTTTAALATTYTGLIVGNPSTSTVNLVMDKFCCAQFAVGAAGAIGIMTGTTGTNTVTDTLVPRNRKVGGVRSVATANAGQTISTPVLEQVFGTLGSLATTGYGLQPGIVVDLEGSLIIPPGFFVAAYTTVVTTTALIFSFEWTEVPA